MLVLSGWGRDGGRPTLPAITGEVNRAGPRAAVNRNAVSAMLRILPRDSEVPGKMSAMNAFYAQSGGVTAVINASPKT